MGLCDVSRRFFIYFIVYFQRLQRWADRIGCKSSHTCFSLPASASRLASLPPLAATGMQVPRHGEHLSGREVLSIFLNMPERVSVRQTWSWQRDGGTRTSLQAQLYLQIATYESLMVVCDCIVNNWTGEKPDSFLDNEASPCSKPLCERRGKWGKKIEVTKSGNAKF